ncbi:hypothetical protein RFI_13850 [Reticulomyxa filosa]|uniref:CAP-Gly domain-containing protein n=1 Tax=Reticulomyxa filosa TaxID=46433 RepID=X6NDC7_RETFI|nr:hypothetical protein RFI_13850 [Reticulomyxa filosa]|eukprot:ETO23332.1 hypothetical protein RFI_13850 [Reticulomyxa filosa]
MSVCLTQGDVVVAHLPTNITAIGLIRFIGIISGGGLTPYVGLETVEPIDHGHDGTINGQSYFSVQKGHGIHVELSKIIKKLTMEEVLLKLKEVIEMFKVISQSFEKSFEGITVNVFQWSSFNIKKQRQHRLAKQQKWHTKFTAKDIQD